MQNLMFPISSSTPATTIPHAQPNGHSQYPVDRIDFSKSNVEGQSVWFTPNFAKFLVDHRGINRNASPTLVSKYARDQANGDWTPGSVILFDPQRLLRNGMHRLMAQVQSQKTVLYLVMVNQTEEQLKNADTGRPWSLRDHYQQEGRLLAGSAAAVDSILCYLGGRTDSIGTYSNAEKIRKDEEYRASINAVFSGPWERGHRYRVAPVLGALVFAHARFPSEVMEFINQYATGLNLTEGSPAKALREIINGKPSLSSQKDRSTVTLQTLYAVRAHVERRALSKIGRVFDLNPSKNKAVSFFLSAERRA